MADYTIQRGDTLSKIAKANNTTVADIMSANPYITNANKIYAGKTLVIPGASTTAATTAPVTTTAPSVATPTATAPTQQQVQDIVSGIPQQTTNTYGITEDATIAQWDPETDTSYQQTLKSGNASIMQDMVNRGIINSTTTSSQMAQLLSRTAPEYEQMYYDRAAAEQARQLQRAQFLAGIDQQAFENQQVAQNNVYDLYGQLATMDDEGYAEYRTQLAATQAERAQNIQTVQAYYEQMSADIKAAMASVSSLGYVDNAAALILGVEVGTTAAQAQQAIAAKQQELQNLEVQMAYLVSQNQSQTAMENQAISMRDAYYNPRVLQEIGSPVAASPTTEVGAVVPTEVINYIESVANTSGLDQKYIEQLSEYALAHAGDPNLLQTLKQKVITLRQYNPDNGTFMDTGDNATDPAPTPSIQDARSRAGRTVGR